LFHLLPVVQSLALFETEGALSGSSLMTFGIPAVPL
jgi:hypothetical protein